ncbi:response regulator [Steroidobacter sp.]|uniref:ATP-binding response regulator n=1 Tax=Steroidobacter sp. TaxID=1978227 RepID=UPI001A3C803C|nr:response regulator [Steroidobacter sp.]MBL8265880.1 response regulator [Steroidobacter sp.]
MFGLTQWWHKRRRPASRNDLNADAGVLQLQAINKRLQLYLDRAPLACIVWDTHHVVRAWNPAAAATFGFTEAEAIGRHIHELVATPSSMPTIDEICPRLLAGIEYPDGVVLETRRKDGSQMQCHWHLALVDRGTVDEGVIAFAGDVTARLQADRDRELLEKSRALAAMAGGIAHDFNNILLAICGNARLAADDLPADHPAQLSLAEVQRASARAAGIINQILAFSGNEEESSKDVVLFQDAAATGRPSAAQVLRGQGQSVLYLDDEESLVYLVTRVLQRLGYRVAGFTDAHEALAAFRSNPAAYEAVVTDLSMPSMSGIEFASQVLSLRPEVPVVMTSGYVRAKDRESVMKTGVRDLLLKPNTVEELGDVLHRLMRETKTQRAG